MTDHCETVKRGQVADQDFDDFLKHVNDCQACQRRIRSQIVVNFKQRQMEMTDGD